MIAILYLQGKTLKCNSCRTPMQTIILPILAKASFLLLLVLTAKFTQTSRANRIVPPLIGRFYCACWPQSLDGGWLYLADCWQSTTDSRPAALFPNSLFIKYQS
jgi:hypothetical protein